MFTVDPINKQRLVELLAEATEVTVSRAPGYISAKLHRCIDGSKVTMLFQEALKIARFDPGIYQVVAESV